MRDAGEVFCGAIEGLIIGALAFGFMCSGILALIVVCLLKWMEML